MRYLADKVYQGIVLQKVYFRETSLICEIITPEVGKIKLLAKGIRKPDSPNYGLLQNMAELEFSLHNKKNSEWHILKTAELIQTYASDKLQTTQVLQAGCELFIQHEIQKNEAHLFYDLIKNFLNYTQHIKKNSLALFWRLLIRLFALNGISPSFTHCIACGGALDIIESYYADLQGFLCQNCTSGLQQISASFTTEEQKLLKILPSIGKYLDSLEISDSAARNITMTLLKHLNLHFNNHFHLKSLKGYLL
jgi:DNA repair protein RecO (recombination protein O)